MWFGIISIFPEIFRVLTDYGLTSYAYKKNLFSLNFFNPKSYVKKNIYNKPYGGGKGVIISSNPLLQAINESKKKKPNAKVVYVSPKGKMIDNNLVLKLSKLNSIIFISGRYEEIDYRIIKNKVDLEVSIGDFILSGGELPIMTIIDSISRLIPQVMKNSDSINIESFSNKLLDYPQYTKPRSIENMEVPSILLKGNHYEISKWRYKQRLGHTFYKRPDLLYEKKLSEIDKSLLNQFITSFDN